mmetsp:Transcript_8661/g.18466  ORF Transcript_8661/g.18466 Transcript_8661/m.18466 type:complete len:145 (+) Transcript_8661:2-436(+)
MECGLYGMKRRSWKNVGMGVGRWCVLVLYGAVVVVVTAQTCNESPRESCYENIVEGALPCYCLESNWFYTFTCCFPEPLDVEPMQYSCWCRGSPTTAGIVAISIIMPIAALGALAAVFVSVTRKRRVRKRTRAAEDGDLQQEVQ